MCSIPAIWAPVLALLLTCLGVAGAVTGTNPPQQYVEGELLVKFQGGCDGPGAARARADFGHTVKHSFVHVGWQHIALPAGVTVAEALPRYRQHPDVLGVAPNFILSREKEPPPVPVPARPRVELSPKDAAPPDDPWFSDQWGLRNTCAPAAWEFFIGSTNVVVAILDSGINYLHEDLAANMWRNPWEIPGNGMDGDGNGWVDDIHGVDFWNHDGNPMDEGSAYPFGIIYHGTGIAGIIGAAVNNGAGMAGINWHVQLMALRTANRDGMNVLHYVTAAADYAIGMKLRGVNVVVANMSFGGPDATDLFGDTAKQLYTDLVNTLGQAGIVAVAGAGNDAADNETRPYYPASCEAANVISVAASTPGDWLADFSNWGRTHVHLAAPGTDIRMTWGPGTNDYAIDSGTSYATPHVAGTVALLAAAHPGATVAQLKEAILATTDPIEAFDGLMSSGGRLNIARALLHLRTNQPPVMIVPPQNEAISPGGHVTLKVGVGGTPTITYQWFRGSLPLAGATNATLRLTNLMTTESALWVRASNAFGVVASDPVQVVVDPALPPLVAWGAQQYGQCAIPRDLTNVVAVAGGRWHSLALRLDGTVSAWGENWYGQTSVPDGLSDVKAIAASTYTSLALRRNGTVVVWGNESNFYGETNVPAGLSDVAAIASGQYHHLALHSNGTVVAWGMNTTGQTNVPPGLTNVVGISAGWQQSVALRRDGTVVAWGVNTNGECDVPADLTNAIAVVSGTGASLALRRDGTVVSWGGNPYGQRDIPPGLSNVVAIAGYAHFLALKADGTVVAWGAGMTNRAEGVHWGQAIVPTTLSNVVSIASNGRHSLALVRMPVSPLNVVVSASPTNSAAPPLTVQFSGQAAGGPSPSDTTDDLAGTVSAQGQNPDMGEVAANAFDNSAATKWLDFAYANPGTRASWIQYHYAAGSQRVVTSYTITAANDAPERDPADWRLLGSNDGGATWTPLDTRIGQTFSTRLQKRVFTVSNATPFDLYRLQIDRVANPAFANSVQLSELEFIGTPPYRYDWSFGDGTTSTLQNPQHVYTQYGSYLAVLGVSCGPQTGTNTVLITVGMPLDVTLAAAPATGPTPLTVSFTAQGLGGNASRVPYDTTDDGAGTVTAQGYNPPDETALKAFDNVTGTKWLDFAAANPTTRASWIQYQYAGGLQCVVSKYTVTSANDCPERDPANWRLLGSSDGGTVWTVLDSRINQVFSSRFQPLTYAIANPNAYGLYRLQIDRVANPATANSVQLSELQLIGNPAYSYAWSFGDGGTSTAQHPQHTYASSGTYSVTLTVSDGSATISRTETVKALETGPGEPFVPNDPYFFANNPPGFLGQWHLNRTNTGAAVDINVWGAWARGLTGEGVTIGIVDGGVEYTHPDLFPNYDAVNSWDFYENDADPMVSSDPALDTHGTAVAGLIAARGGNSIGVTGVAPHSSLAILRALPPENKVYHSDTTAIQRLVDAAALHSTGTSAAIAIKNWSLGEYGGFGAILYPQLTLIESNVVASSMAGVVQVMGAANSRLQAGVTNGHDADANRKNYCHLPEALVVTAADSQGFFAEYANYGACVVVTTPSGQAIWNGGLNLITTDRIGDAGYNTNRNDSLPDRDFTSIFGGTSSATAIMSGVMALAKQAQPALNTRMAKHLLARTCRLLDPNDATPMGGWTTNGAGFRFNNNYGFGLVDADALTLLAAACTGVTPLVTNTTGPVLTGKPLIPIADATGITQTASIASLGPLEEVCVRLRVNTDRPLYRGDCYGQLQLEVLSPCGTHSLLAYPCTTTDKLIDPNTHQDLPLDWTFTTHAFWGENPQGTWTVKLSHPDASVDKFGSIARYQWDSFEIITRSGELTTLPGAIALKVCGVISNQFAFTLQGSAGQVVRIESSTDLTTWTPCQTNTLTSGTLTIRGLEIGTEGRRFYRARLLSAPSGFVSAQSQSQPGTIPLAAQPAAPASVSVRAAGTLPPPGTPGSGAWPEPGASGE